MNLYPSPQRFTNHPRSRLCFSASGISMCNRTLELHEREDVSKIQASVSKNVVVLLEGEVGGFRSSVLLLDDGREPFDFMKRRLDLA